MDGGTEAGAGAGRPRAAAGTWAAPAALGIPHPHSSHARSHPSSPAPACAPPTQVVNGSLTTELGVYTSWECDAARPGYYRALIDLRLLAADGTREWRAGEALCHAMPAVRHASRA